MGTKGCQHPCTGAELAQREVKVNASPLNHDASNLYAACQQSINMHFTTMPECLIEGETASYSCRVFVCVCTFPQSFLIQFTKIKLLTLRQRVTL